MGKHIKVKNICKNIIDIDFELEKAIKKYDFKNLKIC